MTGADRLELLGVLGDGDAVARVRKAFPTRIVKIRLDPDSPWVGLDVEPAWGEDFLPVENRELKFAVWRSNGALYFVDNETVAVDDDPIPDYGELVEWVKVRIPTK